MSEKLQFRISSALKNIIGSDLINDDFIAVFELVKNSYDAHATEVEIIFDKINSKNAKIIIKDNGKGMNYDDLLNKWLFVAYSAKSDGTEEENFDYRDKIKVKRAYAGAKGIGRFSCDRLGSFLLLETKKQEINSKVEVLLTDWEKFEGNITEEFVNISVAHDTIEISNYGLDHGTVLEISNLRNQWNRDKLLKLKGALAKLINPNTKNSQDKFKIKIIANSELDEDIRVKEKGNKKKLSKDAIYKDIVNGDVENFIFEALELKTTKIISEVSLNNTNTINTSLYEGGKLVFKVIEKNDLLNLKNIDFTIYYLNRSAKLTFSRRMGIPPVEYGHIFVYKNGLRIFPYGERGEDPLKMDNRKAQGQNRNLGTREVIGYVNIHDKNDDLNETSSRGDGLKKTETYTELYKWFYVTLKRLERYIINVSDWGKDLSEDAYIKLDEQEKVVALRNIVSKLTKSKNFISIEYAQDLFEILEQKQNGSARGVLSEIKSQILKDNFDKNEVLSNIQKAEKKIGLLEKRTDNAEDETLDNLIKNEALEQKLDEKVKQNLFLQSVQTLDKDRIIVYHHDIGVYSLTIQNWLNNLSKELSKGRIDLEYIKKFIEATTRSNNKILAISRFATKANFNFTGQDITEDIISYIEQYTSNVFQEFFSEIKLHFDKSTNIGFITRFKPIEISVLMDNLINNSIKAHAKNIYIKTKSKSENHIELVFRDDGDGLSKIITNPQEIFDKGFTTTTGSGLGLFHVATIVKKELNGEIEVNDKYKNGFELIIRLTK